MAIIWMFENQHFNDAWIPFDTINQKRLEFAYRHHDELAQHFKDPGKVIVTTTTTSTTNTHTKQQPRNKISSLPPPPSTTTNNNNTTSTTLAKTAAAFLQNIDLDEEDPSAFDLIQFNHNCISIVLKDSHFNEPVTLYPHMLLASLSDRDILVARMEQDPITLDYYH
ncbi:hypothetical protein BDA99DRAFT_529745 [Phascolomyces articulosus]|uniref:Uncharacterized protein n=1 Tax=Phascolomyces articulosus TaxID=60185 RepID=A0AAD5JWB3_9FUNG|nr:hypothetical protein BDA99DRAFT_529745 [Phascolomyces articulosus]